MKKRMSLLAALSAFSSLVPMQQSLSFSAFCEGINLRSSKGKGKNSGKKWGPRPSGQYDGVSNGKRECEHRMRQIARGIIHVTA